MSWLGGNSSSNFNNSGNVSSPFGDGEHESKRKFLAEERQHEYQEHLKHMKDAENIKEKRLLKERGGELGNKEDEEEEEIEEEMQTFAEETQTDGNSEAVIRASHVSDDEAVQTEGNSPVSGETSPVHRPGLYRTSRERFMDDLHGTARCFPDNPYLPSHVDARDDKYERQVAYAEDLRWQIQEKKRLDEVVNKKERDDDVLYKKRLDEQQKQDSDSRHQGDSWKGY